MALEDIQVALTSRMRDFIDHPLCQSNVEDVLAWVMAVAEGECARKSDANQARRVDSNPSFLSTTTMLAAKRVATLGARSAKQSLAKQAPAVQVVRRTTPVRSLQSLVQSNRQTDRVC